MKRKLGNRRERPQKSRAGETTEPMNTKSEN